MGGVRQEFLYITQYTVLLFVVQFNVSNVNLSMPACLYKSTFKSAMFNIKEKLCTVMYQYTIINLTHAMYYNKTNTDKFQMNLANTWM